MITQSSRVSLSRAPSRMRAGAVLKIRSNRSSRPASASVRRLWQPHAWTQARSPYFRADTVTSAPRASSRSASSRPIRP